MSSRPGVVLLLAWAMLASGCDRQAAAPEQANSAAPDEVAAAGPAAPALAVTGFDRGHKGEPAPVAQFIDADGRPATLADFRGKPLLVNLWATWCAPCVAEMPTLDRVAGKLESRVRVVAISQDLEESPAKVQAFLRDRKLARIQPYRDPKLQLSTHFQANLPVTILYDAAGREMWRRAGGFAWDSAEAARAIAEAE